MLAAKFPEVGIGLVGVAFAFGLTVLTMAYAVGHISGGHFNPAITIGLATAKRFDWKEALPYIVTIIVLDVVTKAMAEVKEVNFFIGPDTAPHTDEDEWWRTGNWHRGVAAVRYSAGFGPPAEKPLFFAGSVSGIVLVVIVTLTGGPAAGARCAGRPRGAVASGGPEFVSRPAGPPHRGGRGRAGDPPLLESSRAS